MSIENFKKNMDKNKLENDKEIKEENIPEFSSLEELDPKLFNLIKDIKIDIPDFSKSIKKNVMADYRKYYRYGIFWRKIKIKLQDLKDFLYEHLPGNLELKSDLFRPIAATGMILFLFTIGIITYYFFYHSNKNQPNPVANNNNSVSTPKLTIMPTATPSLSPNIDENNNSTGINNEVQKHNTQISNDKKNKKPEEIKGTNELENKIAQNTHPKSIKLPVLSNDRGIINNNDTNNINSKENTKLADIRKISVNLFATINNQHTKIDETEKQWLENLNSLLAKELNQIKGEYQWEAVTEDEAEAGLQVDIKEKTIFLVNLNGEEIWKMALGNYLDETSETTANNIIKKLQQDLLLSLNNEKKENK